MKLKNYDWFTIEYGPADYNESLAGALKYYRKKYTNAKQLQEKSEEYPVFKKKKNKRNLPAI